MIIDVSDVAVERMKEMLAEKDGEQLGVRIYVLPG